VSRNEHFRRTLWDTPLAGPPRGAPGRCGDTLAAMRKYAIWGTSTSPSHERWVREVGRAFEADGFVLVDDHADADFVLNMFDTEDPKAFRRASRGTYSASFYELDEVPEDVLRTSYPNLVRTLANVVVLHVPGQGVWFTTMERGTYKISDEPQEVFERLAPLAKSKLVIDNEFVTDLEPELWDGDEVTADISAAGKRMGELDLLPAPFPVHEFLNERDLRHVMRLYQVGGLSYGNLSARKDEVRFWMSASGVDKTALEEPGRDILLVTGYDEPNARMRISVPPGVEPRRVSVDAIEHWMIYQAHPDVAAILHVHAWMEGIAATDINYPCGTQELAESVAELIDREPDPAHAVIGLRNHGITATGESLNEILDRIQADILRQVPMT
jgi:ribulose-5-phosphate 4-epimerase/fuculose-1-phosphate aldolase